MNLAIRRSKMISFRLSPEEYETLQAACTEQHVRSISDMARMAMERIISPRSQADPLCDEVRDLRDRVRLLAFDLDRLSRVVETAGNCPKGKDLPVFADG